LVLYSACILHGIITIIREFLYTFLLWICWHNLLNLLFQPFLLKQLRKAYFWFSMGLMLLGGYCRYDFDAVAKHRVVTTFDWAPATGCLIMKVTTLTSVSKPSTDIQTTVCVTASTSYSVIHCRKFLA